MTQATIELTGIGPVAIDTDATEVTLVGALTIDGNPVNCRTAKVRRNKRAATIAEQNDGVWLREIKPGHFIVNDR